MDFAELGLDSLVSNLWYVPASLVLLWFAKRVRDAVTPFDDDKELFENNNHALGIATAGYYLGVMIAVLGVLTGGESAGFVLDVRDFAVYGLLAIIFLNVARVVTDKLLLSKFSINKELIEDKNDGTGWAMFGVYVATGLIVRGAVGGESESFVSGLGATFFYFLLAQVVLLLAGWAYQRMTSYDFHHEIGENNNVAAGIAFMGFLSAIGVVVGSAAMGSVTVSLEDATGFLVWTVVGVVLLALTNAVVTERIFVPGHKVAHEIAVDHNEGAAWLSVAAYQAVAWFIVSSL